MTMVNLPATARVANPKRDVDNVGKIMMMFKGLDGTIKLKNVFIKRTVAATGALVEKNEGGRLGHWKDLKMVLIRKIRCRDHHLYYMDSGALHAMEGSLRILHCPLVNHPRTRACCA